MSADTPWPTPPEEPERKTAANAAHLDDMMHKVQDIARENQRLFERLLASEQRFRHLAKAVWMVQEEERRRLARDLHDGIGQTLTALKNQLQRTAQHASGQEQRETLDALAELTGQALHDTRELSRLLRPPVLDDLGLGPALRWLVRSIREASDVDVSLAVELDEERVSPELETLVFRMAQEGLTNVVRHSGATAAQVSVARKGNLLELEIADQGCGFEPDEAGAAEDGVGLRGMRDRVALFGGRLRIEAQPGKGTTLRMSVPVNGVEVPGEPG